MPNIGPLELVIVLIILLVIFGPKRLPGLGKSLGTGMREFKDSISGSSKHDDDDETDRPLLEKRGVAGAETVTDPADGERASERDAERAFGPRT
jgi:sec-independent protein translocase protein TatA